MFTDRVNNINVEHWGSFVQLLSQWKSNTYYILWVCVCSLRQTACKAHAPYCFLWPVWLYHNFPHYLIKGTKFWYTLLNIKRVFWYSLQYLFETFFILRRIDRVMIKMFTGVLVKYFCSCQKLMKLEFLTHFRKILKFQILWKSVQWERSCSMRTARQTNMTKLIVDFAILPNCRRLQTKCLWKLRLQEFMLVVE